MSDGGAGPFRIGALAARSGRSIHTIRWYEAEGLMPGVARDAAGRRVFREEHVDWLDLIERLQRTGMSLADVRRYAVLVVQGRKTLVARRTMLAEHRERVKATIADWNASLRLIERKIGFYDEWAASGKRPPLVRRAGK